MSAEDQAKLALTEWLVGAMDTHSYSVYTSPDGDFIDVELLDADRFVETIIDQWADLTLTIMPALAERRGNPVSPPRPDGTTP